MTSEAISECSNCDLRTSVFMIVRLPENVLASNGRLVLWYDINLGVALGICALRNCAACVEIDAYTHECRGT